MISGGGEYTVFLEHDVPGESKSDVIEFTVSLLHKHEEGNTVLHSSTFEHASIAVGREIARRYGEHLMKSDVKLSLWAKALGKQLGFEVDLSKGLEYFFEDVTKNSSTEMLKLYLTEAGYEPYRIAVENELKTRGVI